MLVVALFHAGFNTFPFVFPYSPPALALVFAFTLAVIVSEKCGDELRALRTFLRPAG